MSIDVRFNSKAAFTPKAPGTRLHVDFVWRPAAFGVNAVNV